MNRALFHGFPLRWRVAAFFRRRAARRSMAEFRQRDPSARPISLAKVAYITAVICAVAAAYYLGEAHERKRQGLMEGLYHPTPAFPSTRLDCGKEAAIACRAQARMEEVRP